MSEKVADKRKQRKKAMHIASPFDMERIMGIEPTLFAWEAKVLPLNYIRK